MTNSKEPSPDSKEEETPEQERVDSEAPETETSEDAVQEETNTDDPAEQKEDSKEPEAPANSTDEPKKDKTRASRFKWLKRKKVWIPTSIILILVILGAVPFTRYKVLGLVIKHNYQVEVVDAQSSQPVSAATVSINGKTALTNNYGYATLKVPVGKKTLKLTKEYYKSRDISVLVPFRSHGAISYSLQATGRQVHVSVINKINNTPVDNALISASGSQARTNEQGQAVIVLPADKTNSNATITASGYNSESTTVKITAAVVAANSFSLVPAGQIYFLSNSTGTVDVMKANLDGSDPQVAVAGTGYEDAGSSTLFPSADWKYLALFDQRSATNPGVYLINTSNDQVTNIDEGNASFNFDGWTPNDTLVYSVYRNAPSAGQATQALKSYNANSKQLNILDQSTSFATTYGTESSQLDGIELLSNNLVVYENAIFDNSVSNNSTINSISASGTNKETLLSLPASSYYLYGQSTMLTPSTVAYEAQTTGNNSTPTYYEYSNGQVTQLSATDLTAINALQNPKSFDLSPAGDKTAWSSSVNGHTAINVGNSSGADQKQVALLDNTYQLYGWFSDSYLLVVKNQDELDIMPVSGISSQSQLIKITDFL